MNGYNVAFPGLAGTDDPAGQQSAAAFLTTVFSFVGATGLALAVFLRADLVDVLLGRSSALAEDVVAVTAAIGLANLMLHGAGVAPDRPREQDVMARLVAVELPVNLVLTILFVVWWGAVGAALATLATVALMKFVAFPAACRGRRVPSELLRPEVDDHGRRVRNRSRHRQGTVICGGRRPRWPRETGG